MAALDFKAMMLAERELHKRRGRGVASTDAAKPLSVECLDQHNVPVNTVACSASVDRVETARKYVCEREPDKTQRTTEAPMPMPPCFLSSPFLTPAAEECRLSVTHPAKKTL